MQRRVRLLIFFASLAGSFGARPMLANADEGEARTPQMQYRLAHRALASKDWDEARSLLLDLWSKGKTYDVASSLAQVEYQLGHYDVAAEYLAYALDHVGPAESAETLERMRRGMQELRTKVGVVQVTTDPPDARVLLDGREVTVSRAGEVFASPGERLLEARLAGWKPETRSVRVVVGQTVPARLQLTAESSNTPPRTAPPLVGYDGTPAPEPHTTRPIWPIVVGSAVATASIGVAVGFAIAARGAESDWETVHERVGRSGCADGSASPSDCAALRDAYDRQRRDARWSTVGIGVAAVSAVATLSYVLFWPDERGERTTAQRLAPTVSADGSGAAFTWAGHF